MKAIAYHIGPKEEELLVLANYKKHDITIIANSLTLDTVNFVTGKHVLIAFNEDPIDASMIDRLKVLGITYIVSYAYNRSHLAVLAAKSAGI